MGKIILSTGRRITGFLAILFLAFFVLTAEQHNVRAQQSGTVPGQTLGNSSNSDLWRAVRKGVRGKVSIPDKKAGQLIQSEGDNWRAWRNGPVSTYGIWGLLGIIILLALFFLLRGRIKIDSGWAGKTIERFNSIERFSHWLLAVSFIILGLTGLNTLYGRYALKPVLGDSAFASLTGLGKWLHNYLAWAFMIGLVMILILWIKDNGPRSADIKWLLKGGGMFAKNSHPPSWKFNAGQKILFWLVILVGFSISLSGIALLFPFQIPLFAKTFAVMNIFGTGLPTQLPMLQEMQLAQTWHAILGLALMVVIIAHIYIGTIGMQGAFDAMGTGQVDQNWAKEHHSLWAQNAIAGGAKPLQASPDPSVAQSAETQKPEGLSGARDGKPDDLKLISGVGPKLEKTLNGLGMYHFDQIANWSRSEVNWVDDHLNFKGRIDREDWIDQASKLALSN